MPALLIQFVVIALLAGIGLWVLSQFPTLDGTVVKFIRIAGKSLSQFLSV